MANAGGQAPPGGGPPPVPLVQPAPQPLPAGPALFGLPPQGGPTSQHPYRDFYADINNDKFNSNYPQAYNEFVVPIGGVAAPNTRTELARKVFEVGDQHVPMALLLLTRANQAAPDDVGMINVYHRLTKFAPRLGLPTTPWDNVGFAFMGDLVDGQAPPSVIWSNDYFASITTQLAVPSPAQLDQLLAANQGQQIFGPFNAGDAGVDVIRTRRCMLLPTKYIHLLLDQPLTPRQAWDRLRGSMVNNGDDVACAPLIDWLRVCLTKANNAATTSPIVQAHPLMPQPTSAQDMAILSRYRWTYINHDLPNLRPGPLQQGAQQIAQGLGVLVAEQRLARTEAAQRHAASVQNKTPTSLFQGQTLRLMRWVQVPNEGGLPPVYTDLANAPKGQQRRVIQAAVNDALERLQYQHLQIQVTTTIAKRIIDLEWTTTVVNDFSTGIHHFSIGYVSDEEAQLQRIRNREADMIQSGSTVPSLADTKALLSDAEVHIPMSLLQARVTQQRMHVFWDVLLGTAHPLTVRQREFAKTFAHQELELERVLPRDPRHYLLVPALLTRRVQLATSYWLLRQSTTDDQLPIPNLLEVFDDIGQGKDWAPQFPSQYLLEPTATMSSQISVSSGLTQDLSSSAGSHTGTATTTTVGGGGPPAGGGGTKTRELVRNKVLDRWQPYYAMNLATRKVKDYCRTANITLPFNKTKKCMYCLSWHLRGQCNTACGSAADHAPHSPEEADELEDWLKPNYRIKAE